MSQMSFSDFEYAGKRKQTRRERFLAEMDQVVPWTGLLGLIEPFYPKAGGGRKPYPLETMLRIHLLQNWFSLSDPAMEEALYEITPMRQFARLTLSAPIPEDTTIMNFRHLLEKHQLAPAILAVINGYLRDKGLSLRQGTIVDATIIHAPSSTKNKDGERDPEMHQTKKGNPLSKCWVGGVYGSHSFVLAQAAFRSPFFASAFCAGLKKSDLFVVSTSVFAKPDRI